MRVATSEGRGSGRFVTLALLDALDAGAVLTTVRFQPYAPLPSAWSVDFVFGQEGGDEREIIRIGLDATGNVVAAELLRGHSSAPARAYRQAKELAAALRSGQSLQGVKLEFSASADEPRAVRLRLGNRDSFLVELGDLAGSPLGS